MMNGKAILINGKAILLGATLTISASACNTQPSSVPKPTVPAQVQALDEVEIPADFQAPPFALESIEGETLALEDYLGRVVVVHFGASWCPFCRAEDPHLEALQQAYKGRGVQVLVIDVEEPEADAARWYEEAGFTFPMLLDRDGAVAARYAPPEVHPDLPRHEVMVAANLIIDRSGRVRYMSLLDTRTFDAELVALQDRLDEVLAEEADA